MPKAPRSSSIRKQELVDFIELFGAAMVKPCSYCAENLKACKVHPRSGKCSECSRRGRRCNVQISQSEFARLRTERSRLDLELEACRVNQRRLRKELRVSLSKELRLLNQWDALKQKASDAIAVESANIYELEQQEATASASANVELFPSE